MGQCQSQPGANASRSRSAGKKKKASRNAIKGMNVSPGQPQQKQQKNKKSKKFNKLSILTMSTSKSSNGDSQMDLASPSENTAATHPPTPMGLSSPQSSTSPSSTGRTLEAFRSQTSASSNVGSSVVSSNTGNDSGYEYSEDSNSIAAHSHITSNSTLEALQEEDEETEECDATSGHQHQTTNNDNASLALVDFCDLMAMQQGAQSQSDNHVVSRQLVPPDDGSLAAPSDEESLSAQSRYSKHHPSSSSVMDASDSEVSLEPNLRRSTLKKTRRKKSSSKSRSRSSHKSKPGTSSTVTPASLATSTSTSSSVAIGSIPSPPTTKKMRGIIPSPERVFASQTNVKLLHQKIIRPSSIIHRKPSINRSTPVRNANDSSNGNINNNNSNSNGMDADMGPTHSSENPIAHSNNDGGKVMPDAEESADLPKESVDAHTLSDFNKLKLQVQLAKRADKQKRKKDKIKERMEDLQGYKDLWGDFEKIENQVRESDTESVGGDAQHRSTSARQSDSMKLKDSNSWYFDFSMISDKDKPAARTKGGDALSLQGTKGGLMLGMGGGAADDDADNRSQSNFSLLSAASMEAQKRIFEEKRRERRNRRNRQSKQKQQPKWKRKDRIKSDDDGSVSSNNTSTSRLSHASAFKGQTEEGDYGPPRRIMGNSSATKVAQESDEETPPRYNYQRYDDVEDDANSLISGCTLDQAFVPEGDYGVVRRRRRSASYQNHNDWDDDSSISTQDNSWKSLIARDIQQTRAMTSKRRYDTPVAMEIRNLAKQAPVQKYGFDPSAPLSAQLDALSNRIDNFQSSETDQINDTVTPAWHDYQNPLRTKLGEANSSDPIQMTVITLDPKKGTFNRLDEASQTTPTSSATAARAGAGGSAKATLGTPEINKSLDSDATPVMKPSTCVLTPPSPDAPSSSALSAAKRQQMEMESENGAGDSMIDEDVDENDVSGFGAPLGAYNPNLAMLSSDAFLDMAAVSAATTNTDDVMDHGSNDSDDEPIVDDFAERLAAVKKRYSSGHDLSVAAANRPKPKPQGAGKYDPKLTMLSTEQFLWIASGPSANLMESIERSKEAPEPPRESHVRNLFLDDSVDSSAKGTNLPSPSPEAKYEEEKKEESQVGVGATDGVAEAEGGVSAMSSVSDGDFCNDSTESIRSNGFRVLHTGEIVPSDSPMTGKPKLQSTDPSTTVGVISIGVTNGDDQSSDSLSNPSLDTSLTQSRGGEHENEHENGSEETDSTDAEPPSLSLTTKKNDDGVDKDGTSMYVAGSRHCLGAATAIDGKEGDGVDGGMNGIVSTTINSMSERAGKDDGEGSGIANHVTGGVEALLDKYRATNADLGIGEHSEVEEEV